MKSSNRSNVNPEAGVIRRVHRVRVNLALDPVNSTSISLDIGRVGILDASLSVSVSREPGISAEEGLALGASGNVGVEVGTRPGKFVASRT